MTLFNAVHTDTLADAQQFSILMNLQKQHVAYESGYNAGLRHRGTGQPQIDQENSSSQSTYKLNAEEYENDEHGIQFEEVKENRQQGMANQTLVPEVALGTLGGFLGTIGLDLARHVGPKLLEWFKAHHGKVHNLPAPPKLTWEHIKWRGYRTLQYAVPTIQGGLIIWYIVDPSGKAKLYLAGFGIIVQYFLNHSNNKTAKDITKSELDFLSKTASGQAFDLGMAMSNPEFMAETGLTEEHLQGLVAQAEAKNNARWHDCIFKGCCTNGNAQSLTAESKRNWCQRLTDCFCCFRVCQNIFKKKDSDDSLDKDPDILDV